MQNLITELLGIEYPIVQGGMAWVADAHLAAAVSNAGGLGIIGSGSMDAALLRREVELARTLTGKPFGVNLMMLNPHVEELAGLLVELKVPVVTTGAGSPAKYISAWKEAGITVIPVVASAAQAKRMERTGADAVVAEGCEAGGHIGEVTTFCLVPSVVDAVRVPVIAAGGIADARGVRAALALGAQGVQAATVFICAEECTAHDNYKQRVLGADVTGTAVTGRSGGKPARCIKTRFVKRLVQMELAGATFEEIERETLGSLRAAKVEGDESRGSFMAGQSAGFVREIRPAAEIVRELAAGFSLVKE